MKTPTGIFLPLPNAKHSYYGLSTSPPPTRIIHGTATWALFNREPHRVRIVDDGGCGCISLKKAMAGVRINRSGKAAQLYSIFRGMIVDLVLHPNQILSEKEVALCLKLSKTPVREAFIRLTGDGMVRVMPHSGTRRPH